jgi:large subunit ribosomal protein L15
MASKTTVWSFRSLTRLAQRRHSCCCFAVSPGKLVRKFSTTPCRKDEPEQLERPRWSYTPAAMKAPFQVQPRDPLKAFKCNSDPEKLDAMYIRIFGRDGRDVLTEEVKWLAVTHKSFDQGRRGFNDRLAYFGILLLIHLILFANTKLCPIGKRIVLLQTMLTLFHSPLATATQIPPGPDPHGRQPFQHKALEGLQNLTNINTSEIISKDRLGALAASYGVDRVTRWKPKNVSSLYLFRPKRPSFQQLASVNPNSPSMKKVKTKKAVGLPRTQPANLKGSGKNVVYAFSLYAIVGALALQRGGAVATEFAREKILKPLGIQ